jgi:hypothetical protein
VIRETLRVRPVIVDVARKLTAPLRIGGYDLPAGTLVPASITGLHAREDIYADPREFRPERFLDEPPGPTRGSRSAAACAAAWARRSRRRRCASCCARSRHARTCARPTRSPSGPRMRNITVAPEHEARVVLQRPLRPAGNPQG